MSIVKIFSERMQVSHYRSLLRELKAIYFIIALVVALLVLTLLVHITGVLAVDISTSFILQSAHSPVLDNIAEIITLLGHGGVITVVAILAALYFWRIGLIKSAGIILLSLLAQPINVALKEIVTRARPDGGLIDVISLATGYSFPSGHAMITMTIYGCIALLVWSQLKLRHRWLIPAIAVVIIFLVGLSRIYLGVHWLSDVLAGWIAGLILLFILAELHKYWDQKL